MNGIDTINQENGDIDDSSALSLAVYGVSNSYNHRSNPIIGQNRSFGSFGWIVGRSSTGEMGYFRTKRVSYNSSQFI